MLAIGVLAVGGVVSAQDAGTIEGVVLRDNGQPLGGITVVVNDLDSATLTRSNGGYMFNSVPPGTYTLTFSVGDNVATLEGIEVESGETSNADLTVDWVVAVAETITVFSASRRQERIVEAPAAISAISEEEIQLQASHSQVPKLLEFTPGMEVTQSGIYDYNLNTRGFNSSLNRRVAVLVDGRDPSIPFLASQEWSIANSLDDLASVEMIRGLSAALYGANASSGVLNMTTKGPRESQGGQVRLTAGELSTFNADLRWAGDIGAGWYYKLVANSRNHDDFYVSRNGAAEYSVPCPVPQGTATDCLPQEAVPLSREDDEILALGLRFDKHIGDTSFFTVEGGSSTS